MVRAARITYPAVRGGQRPIRDPITGRTMAAPRISGTMIHRPGRDDNRGQDTIHRAGRAHRVVREAARTGLLVDRGNVIALDPRVVGILRGTW